jgi:anti-anti-sigma factor
MPLQLFTHWFTTTDVQITAVGDIDMSTAHDFSDYVFRRAGNCKSLIVDLTELSFFDCAGFSALEHIDERCRTAGVRWVIHPARCVLRVTDFCDPRNVLPISTRGDFEPACA